MVSEGFASLGLSRETSSAIAHAKIGVPTPLQMKVIPPALLGRDIVAVSAEGSGRTTAFLLSLVERLGNLAGTRALVLARTKQRLQEIHQHFDQLSVGRPFKVTEILPGGSMAAQETELRERRHLRLAVPQRLTEHMDKGAVNFSSIEMVVLDAADDMVADGLLPQLKRIVTRLPPRRQTLIFTRSLLDSLASFARTYLRDPILIEVASSEATQVVAMPEDTQIDIERPVDVAPAHRPAARKAPRTQSKPPKARAKGKAKPAKKSARPAKKKAAKKR
jgi:ATP-dependent RNA helicase RhlE